MSFFNSIKRKITPSFYNDSSYMTNYSQMSLVTNVYDNERNNSAIDICSRVIANTVASIPINIYKDVNQFKEVVKKDNRYKLLHYQVNDYTSAYTFWHTMEMVKQENGNSFAIIHKFPETKTYALEFVHPSKLVKKPFFKDGFLKYTFNTNSGNKTFDATEVIHFKRDSIDGIMGLDPYNSLKEVIERMWLANKTIRNHYKNDGKSTKFLKSVVTTGDINKLNKAIQKFRKETGGSYFDENNKLKTGNFDNIVSFPGLPGNTEIQEIANELNDALYLATIQACKLDIASHYQIPAHYLNILQAQKSSDVETLQLDFKSSTIQHICRSNRQELEMKLLTTAERDQEMSIEYNTMAYMELDHDTRLKGYESLQKTASISMNEVRQKEHMPPIKNGDEHYLFDQMTTLDQINDNVDEKSNDK